MAAELWDPNWLAQKDGAVQRKEPNKSETGGYEHVHFLFASSGCASVQCMHGSCITAASITDCDLRAIWKGLYPSRPGAAALAMW